MRREQKEFFARCAGGFEDVLARELKGLRIHSVRPLKGGVAFLGGLRDAYRACLWSRTATRVQLVLARVGAHDAQELYDGVAAFPWEDHLLPGATIAVHAHGENRNLRNTQFTALKVKDAVCDRLRRKRGSRPDVDASDPDFALDVTVRGDKAAIYLNLSGESLHRRGYREEGVQSGAPLKETLAAGMLLAASWDAIASEEDAAFVDPMCGSGTLAIEAALIAANRAPGLARNRWGFDGWALHDEDEWQAMRTEAISRAHACESDAGCASGMPRIVASDIDAAAVALAQENARRAEVDTFIEFHVVDAAELARTLNVGKGGALASTGLVAVNPPYGHRLQSQDELPRTYAALAGAVADLAAGWRLAVITPDAALDSALGFTAQETRPCFNGALEVDVRIYQVDLAQRCELDLVSLSGAERSVAVAEEGSEQFAARLRKVAKERLKWARRAGVSCYRIYDADLPDFALSIDLYTGAGKVAGERYLRVAEYQAPASIDPARAARRFADALSVAPALLDVDAAHVFSKVRRREKGGGQYRDAQDRSYIVPIEEAGHVFEADLNGYLDTGIFLDHRVTRQLVGRLARDARFLNLFAYTGTATVHAAAGGAASTMTVDLSKTYLNWARQNMRRNGFTTGPHYFERADVKQWLDRAAWQENRYDLVFCDPPTFSNSNSKSASPFDVQRDHVGLLRRVGALLSDEGLIVFSCNLRNFKLDEAALRDEGLFACDISASTIPHDFERNAKIHRCYLVAADQLVLETAQETAQAVLKELNR